MTSWGHSESRSGGDAGKASGVDGATVPAAAIDLLPMDGLFGFPQILAIADALPVMIAYCDSKQVYRFCNRPIAEWFERPRSEILGRRVREVMGESAYAVRVGALEAALAGERQWFAASFKHPTRGLLTTQSDYIPHRLPNGEVAGVIMLVQDVTEQRTAEVALRESEARFRRIANSAPAPMWVTRADGSRDFVNQAFEDFLGRSDDTGRQRALIDAIHPEDRQRVEQLYFDGLKGGETFEMEGRFRRADGQWRWMRVVSQPRRDGEGRVIGYTGIASDITVAKEAELELRRQVEQRTAELSQSETRFRAIFDSVSTNLILLRPDGMVLDVNGTKAPWRPGGHRDLVAGYIWDAPSLSRNPEYQALVRDMVKDALAGERPEASIHLINESGAASRLDLTLLPVTDARDEIEYLLLEARDVTELRLAQDQLRQSQKMEALGQLTGGIAHDFNNLLTVVVGGLDLIAKNVEEPKLHRYATNALAAAERGARLTAQLLTFSRAQRLEVRPTLVEPLIEEMRPLLRNVLGPGIDKIYQIACEDMPVMADPTQLEVAVLNLAINARDAMPTGGTLTIASRSVAIDDDSELEPGDYVELSISDTGMGMPADVIQRAFEPFFTTKEVGKGTGLGLAMVYGMARQSGGTARIESRENEGTTVSLYFRRVDGESLADEAMGRSSEKAKGEAKDARVLVIDDDPDVRALIVTGLEEFHYRVEEAANGEEGLMRFAAHPPDVVIVDYVMPGMTGAEVARRIREASPDQKILFVSGFSETEAIRAAAPDAPLLAKPFRPGALDAALRDLLSQ